jgi:cap1 methyltransferase
MLVVGAGGNFVCKVFDTFTPFSVGLLYLLRRCFTRVAVHKPHTSRPANAERYVLCAGMRAPTAATLIVPYLHAVNDKLNELKQRWHGVIGDNDENAWDVCHIVAPSAIAADIEFVKYITDMNNR